MKLGQQLLLEGRRVYSKQAYKSILDIGNYMSKKGQYGDKMLVGRR